MRRGEPDAYRPFAQIVVTTEGEAAALSELDPTPHLPPLAVIGNGVDSDYFRPDFDGAEVAPEPDTVIFSGKLSYIANANAAGYLLTEVLPLLRRLRPEARVILAGASPSASLRRLAARVGGVEVTGYVADLRPSLRRAAVAICPVRLGAGIQNKALEAMAMGRPVVLSPLAARPLAEAVDAGAAFVADSPSDYAARCAELLANSATDRQAGARGRRYVMENHRWEEIAADFAALYRDVIAKQKTDSTNG